MESLSERVVSEEFLSELERRYFWWEPVGSERRSTTRIIAQAMSLAGFDDVLRLEQEIGPDLLAETLLRAAPGSIDARSWEFWRGRLTRATGRDLPTDPPVRSFDAGSV
jgi:hypothetical protein